MIIWQKYLFSVGLSQHAGTIVADCPLYYIIHNIKRFFLPLNFNDATCVVAPRMDATGYWNMLEPLKQLLFVRWISKRRRGIRRNRRSRADHSDSNCTWQTKTDLSTGPTIRRQWRHLVPRQVRSLTPRSVASCPTNCFILVFLVLSVMVLISLRFAGDVTHSSYILYCNVDMLNLN